MTFDDRKIIKQAIIHDEYGNNLAVYNGQLVDFNSYELSAGIDEYGICHKIMMVEDEDVSDLWSVAVTGKVSSQTLQPPAEGISFTYYADNPLIVKKLHDTSFIIPSGYTAHILCIMSGCQGDSAKNGSKSEIIFDNGTEHVVSRAYLNGQSHFGQNPDTSFARDGTQLLGNGTNTIILRRTRLSVSDQEIDIVVRGYYIGE